MTLFKSGWKAVGIMGMFIGLFVAGGAFAKELAKSDLTAASATAVDVAITALDGKKLSEVTSTLKSALTNALKGLEVADDKDAGSPTVKILTGTETATTSWTSGPVAGEYTVSVSWSGGDDFDASTVEFGDFEVVANNPATSYTVTGAGNATTINQIGGTLQLTATPTPGDADAEDPIWTSSNDEIATVSDGGLVTAVSNGTVTISVEGEDSEAKGTLTITVKALITVAPSVSPAAVTLVKPAGASASLQMAVVWNAADAGAHPDAKVVTWSVAPASVASVSASGVVSIASGAGNNATATVTATVAAANSTSGSTRTATSTVTVSTTGTQVSSIDVALGAPNTLTIGFGKTVVLTASADAGATNRNIIWTSSDETVATVAGSTGQNATGTVTASASKAGTVTITAMAQDGSGVKTTRTVTVVPRYMVTFATVTGSPNFANVAVASVAARSSRSDDGTSALVDGQTVYGNLTSGHASNGLATKGADIRFVASVSKPGGVQTEPEYQVSAWEGAVADPDTSYIARVRNIGEARTVRVSFERNPKAVVDSVVKYLAWSHIANGNSAESNVLTNLNLLSGNVDSLYKVAGNKSVTNTVGAPLTKQDLQNITVTWASEKPSIIVPATGVVKRQAFSAVEEAPFKITATVSKGGRTATKDFTVTVKKYTSNEEQDVDTVRAVLTWAIIKNDNLNTAENNVVRNLKLPARAGAANLPARAGVTIKWESDNTAAVNVDATGKDTASTGGTLNNKVTRPIGGPAEVTLTATISKLNANNTPVSVSKVFNLVVPAKKTITDKEILFNDTTLVYNGLERTVANASMPASLTGIYGTFTGAGQIIYTYDPVPVKGAGDYTVWATFENDDSRGVSRGAKITVARKPLASAMLTVTQRNAEALVYNGEAKTVATFSVVDNGTPLREGIEFTTKYVNAGETVSNGNGVTNAGTGYFRVNGIGNYTDSASANVVVTKRTISIDTARSAVASKVYDGSDSVPVGNIAVAFNNLVEGDQAAFEAGKPYAVTGARYTSGANVNAEGVVTATTVRIDTTGKEADLKKLANNYQLASQPTFRKAGVAITKKAPAAEDFTAIDTAKYSNLLFTGVAVPVSPKPAYKSPKNNGTKDTLTVLYSEVEDDTLAPTAVGDYSVYVWVRGDNSATGKPNFENGKVKLADYKIGQKKPAVIDTALRSDKAIVYAGERATLKVNAASPNAGTLTYLWYRNDTLQGGGAVTANTFTFNTTATTPQRSYAFRVSVINSKPGVQEADTLASLAPVSVEVKPPKIAIGSAKVDVVAEGLVYDGMVKEPQGYTVTLGGNALSEGENGDFLAVTTNKTNAGNAILTITGVNQYEGTVNKTYKIERKELTIDDIEWTTENEYNGKAQKVSVIAANGLTGLGKETILYDGKAEVPTKAGVYAITATFAQGQNFTASDTVFDLGDYEIYKKLLVRADVKDTVSAWPIEILIDSVETQSKGIGAISIEGYTGKWTLYYGSDTIVPMELGDYAVLVEIEGDDNYEETTITLGSYNIVLDILGVKSADRVVPKPVVTEEAAVAPVAKVAASFTAGPSPVSKASGKVTFFSSKQVKAGGLYVFDANGNMVAKIAAKAGTGAIGSWNLKDKKGAAVADGSYVVKGVLIGKDGTREKVSFVFAVVR